MKRITKRNFLIGTLIVSLLLALGVGARTLWPVTTSPSNKTVEQADSDAIVHPQSGEKDSDRTEPPHVEEFINNATSTDRLDEREPVVDSETLSRDDDLLRLTDLNTMDWDLAYHGLGFGGKDRLREVLEGTFGYVPTNPISALSELDDAKLHALFDGDMESPANDLGGLIGANVLVSEWLPWFERPAEIGIRGHLIATILHRAVKSRNSAFLENAANAQRVMNVVDSYLRMWRNHAVRDTARYALMQTFFEICPVDGGLEMIRRWVVEESHGNEIIEMNLCEALKYWSFADAKLLTLEVLETRRAGPIKGVIRCWTAAGRAENRAKWTPSEVRTVIAGPLADAIERTASPAALLYAQVFAASDLLQHRCERIGYALLQRRDSSACSSYGFHFYRAAGRQSWEAEWVDWFNSGDTYKVSAACSAATGSGMAGLAGNELVKDRLYALAMDVANPGSLRSAASFALSVQDRDNRALAVLESWLAAPEPDSAMLVAMGRIALRSPKARVEALLTTCISDDARTTAERHYPLFLLAMLAPLKSLEICEANVPFPHRLNPESILLAVAVAEAMLPDALYPRAVAVRNHLPQPEPAWIREIRLRLDNPTPREEQRVVAYAWSSASLRD